MDTTGLTEILSIDKAEEKLFSAPGYWDNHRSRDLPIHDECGSWKNFFERVRTNGAFHRPISNSGLTWEHHDTRVFINDSFVIRFHRWIKVTRGDDIFVASWMPCEYTDEDGSTYVDQRFSIATNNEDLLTTIILYEGMILAPVANEDYVASTGQR